jgi:hypothetical protein
MEQVLHLDPQQLLELLMLVVLVAMMLGSRDPPALAYVGPPIVAAFNQK